MRERLQRAVSDLRDARELRRAEARGRSGVAQRETEHVARVLSRAPCPPKEMLHGERRLDDDLKRAGDRDGRGWGGGGLTATCSS